MTRSVQWSQRSNSASLISTTAPQALGPFLLLHCDPFYLFFKNIFLSGSFVDY